VSCSMVGIGMIVHFGGTLIGFLRRRSLGLQKTAKPRAAEGASLGFGSAIPWIVGGLCAVYLISVARVPESNGKFDLNAFSSVPVSFEGRVMPLDSLARNSLRIVSGRTTFAADSGAKFTAIDWLLDLFARPERAMEHKVLRIDHPDIIGLMGLSDGQTR